MKTQVQIYKNQRDTNVEQANAELANNKVVRSQSTKVAQVEADKAVSIREATVQMKVKSQKGYVENQIHTDL